MTFRIICLITAIPCVLWTAEVEREGTMSEVVVGQITEALPAKASDLKGWLWDQFANKPLETKFRHNPITNWETNYNAFACELVRLAKVERLPAESLQKALAKIPSLGDPEMAQIESLKEPPGAIAYLPVGAYSASLQEKSVWIVVVKWAVVWIAESFGHIRIYVFDQATGEVVGFLTCT